MKSPAARVARPTTPMPTPTPMPIALPLLSALLVTPASEEVLDGTHAHPDPGLPVSSAKIQPLIWTANTVVLVLVVSVVASHL